MKLVNATTEVWNHSQAKGTELVVLLAIAQHADPDGFAWPGPKRLQAMARVGGQSVKAAIGKLEAAGELAVLRGQGRGNKSLYRVLCGRPAEDGSLEAMLEWLKGRTEPFLAALGRRYAVRTRPAWEKGSPATPLPEPEKGSPATPFAGEKGYPATAEKGYSATASGGAYRNELPEGTQRTTSRPPPAAVGDAGPPQPDPEVADLCSLLAERIVSNGASKTKYDKKAKSAAWVKDMRLLLDDDLAVDQHGQPVPHDERVARVRRAIEWCQADDFWRGVVLSPGKLREQYDALRLAAARPNGRGNGNGRRPPPPEPPPRPRLGSGDPRRPLGGDLTDEERAELQRRVDEEWAGREVLGRRREVPA